MTSDALVFEEIDVHQAPGFETAGFAVEDLSPGVNIVHGPNAAGKTTLARAIEWLLWPDSAPDRASLVGHWSIEGDDWRAQVDPFETTYQRNGQDTNGPSLPSAEQRDRYRLSLEELLQHDTRNETFAGTILRESAGGFDLSAAVDELGFDSSPSTRRKTVVGKAESAVSNWEQARRRMEELEDEERKLARLEDRLEVARQARQRVSLLEQAIEHAEARDALETAEQRLEAFPDLLGEIEGSEADEIDTLDDRIEEWVERKEDAEATLSGANETLSEVDLPDEGIPEGYIDRLKERRDGLATLENKKQDKEGDLAARIAERSNALSDIPLSIDEEDLETLDPSSWEAVSEFADRAQRLKADREQHEAVRRWLEEGDSPDTDTEELRRGRQHLEDWLAHPSTNGYGVGEGAFRLAVVSSIAIAFASGALGFLVDPVLYLGFAVAVGIFWYGLRLRNTPSGEEVDREVHRRSYEELGLPAPESWSVIDVRDRLTELYDALADHHIEDEREQRLEALQSDVEALERREESLTEQRTELVEAYGISPDIHELRILSIAKGILRWQEHNDRVRALEAEIDKVETQIEDALTELNVELEPYGYNEVEDAAAARQGIRSLENRKQKFDQATGDIDRAKETIETARDTIERLEKQRNAIFEDLNLGTDELDRLRELCEHVPDNREAEKTVDREERRVEREREMLEEYQDFEPDLTTTPFHELEQAKEEAEVTAGEFEDIHTAITEIETRINVAKSDNQVESARAEMDRALARLTEQLHEDVDAMVGDVLANHIHEITSESSRPAVFDYARDVLVRITHGRYELLVDTGAETFRARDTVRDRGLALDELSTATRLQLLLAVRIAFVERQEQGLQLPLILDETLANTDDVRTGVVIDSMLELAHEGRQVFYFTAQGDEVAKWKRVIEEDGAVDHTVIDLAEIRELDRHVEIPDLSDIEVGTAAPPSPDGHDHASYADALSVPPFDPRKSTGETHLWYLVDDVQELHQLLSAGIERWGQLDTLLSRSNDHHLLDDPDRLEAIECRGEALEEFVSCWRRGRGEPVDRQALEDSGAVSDTFIEKVTELADELNGEGERIIEALRDGRVDRFRSNKTDELEAYFEAHGYIETVEPLEADQIRTRVLNQLLTNGLAPEEARKQADELVSRLTA